MTAKKKEAMTIHDVLNDIQVHLKAPKNRTNTSFGGFNYRSCEDILEGLKPLLEKHHATLTIIDEVVAVLDRVYVKASARLSVSAESCVWSSAYAREPLSRKGMDDSQLTGATSSYARKYALNGLFCIDDTADADTKDNSNADEDMPKPNAIKHRFKAGEADELVRQCLDCLERDDTLELKKLIDEASRDEDDVYQIDIRLKVAELFTAPQRNSIKTRLNEVSPPTNGE